MTNGAMLASTRHRSLRSSIPASLIHYSDVSVVFMNNIDRGATSHFRWRIWHFSYQHVAYCDYMSFSAQSCGTLQSFLCFLSYSFTLLSAHILFFPHLPLHNSIRQHRRFLMFALLLLVFLLLLFLLLPVTVILKISQTMSFTHYTNDHERPVLK